MTQRTEVVHIVGGGMSAAVATALSETFSGRADAADRIVMEAMPGRPVDLDVRMRPEGIVPDVRFPEESKTRDWEQRSRNRRRR
ncbi:hypothetical protein ACVIGB_000430 [Bradyrhizobium sp. USDA 4341]